MILLQTKEKKRSTNTDSPAELSWRLKKIEVISIQSGFCTGGNIKSDFKNFAPFIPFMSCIHVKHHFFSRLLFRAAGAPKNKVFSSQICINFNYANFFLSRDFAKKKSTIHCEVAANFNLKRRKLRWNVNAVDKKISWENSCWSRVESD